MTEEERAEWLKERRTGIGGSDVAAILGLSPWATPVTVWLDKTGRAAPQPETEAMRIGTELEDFVARRYTDETGRKVQRYNTMIHRGCLLGNFDRLVIPEGAKVASYQKEIRTDLLLECKTGVSEWGGEVPIYYQTQVQHYMGLEPALRAADVAYLNLSHRHFEVFRVERDDEVIGEMQRKVTEWWNEHILGDKIPAPSNEIDCKLLWARSNPGKTIKADDRTLDLISRLRAVKSQYNTFANEKKQIEGDIKTVLGDAEILVGTDGKPICTWKSPARETETVDWKAVAEEFNPTREQIEKHTKREFGSRQFRLKSAS